MSGIITTNSHDGNENHNEEREKKDNEVMKVVEELELLRPFAQKNNEMEKGEGEGEGKQNKEHRHQRLEKPRQSSEGKAGDEDGKAIQSSDTPFTTSQDSDITTYELLDTQLLSRGLTRLSSWVIVENDAGDSGGMEEGNEGGEGKRGDGDGEDEDGEDSKGGREDWEDCEAECEMDDEAEEEDQVRKWWE
ncbi:hypothetical protein B7463_g3008, partial [Scytalidium lignicola]